MRRLVLFLLLMTSLAARENPFVAQTESPKPAEEASNGGIVILSDEEAAQLNAEENETSPAAGDMDEGDDKTVVNFQNIRFLVSEGEIRIETKDSLQKKFTIRKPMRIILDFESKNDFPTRKSPVPVKPFREIRLGSHEGFYRVVIELEEPVGYTVVPFKYGYILTTSSKTE